MFHFWRVRLYNVQLEYNEFYNQIECFTSEERDINNVQLEYNELYNQIEFSLLKSEIK